MKALRLLVLLAALPAFAQADDFIRITPAAAAPAAGYDGGAVTNPFLAPSGTSSLPGYGFSASGGVGMFLSGSDLQLTVGTVSRLLVNGTSLVQVGSAYQYGWSSATQANGAGADTGLARSSANVVKVTDGGANFGHLALRSMYIGTSQDVGLSRAAANVLGITAGGESGEGRILVGQSTSSALLGTSVYVSGRVGLYMSTDSFSVISSGGTSQFAATSLGSIIGSGLQFLWSSTSASLSGTYDTGFARISAGTVRVTDGTTGYGRIRVHDGTVGSVGYGFNTDGDDTGMWLNGAGNLVFSTGNSAVVQMNTTNIRVKSTTQVNFSSGDPSTTSADAGIARIASTIVGASDGTGVNGAGVFQASQFITTSTTGGRLTSAAPAGAWLASAGQLSFSSTADAGGTKDTGLARSAANLIDATDGSTGVGGFRAFSFAGWSGRNGTGSQWFFVDSAGVAIDASRPLSWSGTANSASAAKDVGIARNQAAELRITDGGGGIGAVRYASPVLPNTGTLGLAAANSNLLITNTGDGDGSTINLPDNPGIGLRFEVVVLVAQTITVNAAAGETIQDAATSGTNSVSSTVGSTICFVAVTSGSGAVWQVMFKTGTWSTT